MLFRPMSAENIVGELLSQSNRDVPKRSGGGGGGRAGVVSCNGPKARTLRSLEQALSDLSWTILVLERA